MAITKPWLIEVVKCPTCSKAFKGFNKSELKKKRKIDHTKLSSSELQAHSLSLFTLAGNSYMKRQQWASVCESVLRLADNLRKYASYLEQQNRKVQSNQAKRVYAQVMLMILMYCLLVLISSQLLLLDTEAFTISSFNPRSLSQFWLKTTPQHVQRGSMNTTMV